MATEQKKEPKKLDAHLVKSRQEVYFNLAQLKEVARMYVTAFHDYPVKGFQFLARQADIVSKKMMTGYGSFLSMPLGIMVRNGARIADDATSKGRYYGLGITSGLLASGASIYFGTTMGAPFVQSALPSLGAFGSTIAAGSASTLLLTVPAFTLGELATASILSVGITAISTIPAALNLGVAWRRSADRAKGIVYDESVFNAKVDKESLDTQFRAAKLNNVYDSMYYLSNEQKQEVHARLSQEFAKAAQEQQEEAAAQAAKAERKAAVARPVSINDEIDSNDMSSIRRQPNGPAAGPK